MASRSPMSTAWLRPSRRSFPGIVRGTGRVGVYFESAAVIVSLTLLGQLLELKARSQTSAAIKSLLASAEDRAAHSRRRHRRGRAAGRMSMSATCCVSGLARKSLSTAWSTEGSSAVDESMLTGEPLPVTKRAGDADRRHAEYDRRVGHARRECRRGDHALADRPDGGASAAFEGPDAANGRSRRRLVRAGVCSSPCHVFRVGFVRAGAALGIWARQRSGRTDHRLSLGPGIGDPRCRSWSRPARCT